VVVIIGIWPHRDPEVRQPTSEAVHRLDESVSSDLVTAEKPFRRLVKYSATTSCTTRPRRYVNFCVHDGNTLGTVGLAAGTWVERDDHDTNCSAAGDVRHLHQTRRRWHRR